MLTEDLGPIRSARMPEGVRLLSPRDPYTHWHERGTIVDDKHHRDVREEVDEPGRVAIGIKYIFV